jgi:hypothetical protein
MPYKKQPKCPECKGNFFAFDFNAGVCIQCKPIDYDAPTYIPGVSLEDRVRYADMDRMSLIANGDL